MKHLLISNNKKLLEKIIPEKGSLPEKEIKSTFVTWYFKIYLN